MSNVYQYPKKRKNNKYIENYDIPYMENVDVYIL